MKARAVSMAFLPAVLLSAVVHAETERLPGTIRQDAVRKSGPHSYEVGGIRVDAASREIRLPARVNMREGLIEVVVSTETGKLHESILVTPVEPVHLHAALLLLGLNPGTNPGWHIPDDPALRLPGWDHPPGDRLDVFVHWETPAGPREDRAESLLMDERTGASLPKTNWVFIGSSVDSRGVYGAAETGSIMTNYHDRLAVIDNPLELGQMDDYTYANTKAIPAVGTAAEIRIAPAPPQQGDNGDDR